MSQCTTTRIPHTIYLQDGSLCNLNKRIARTTTPLVALLEREVQDPRSSQGKRHPLVLILGIVFIGLLRGSKDLKDARLFARLNQQFFREQLQLPLPHGIPDATTISRILRDLEIEELVYAYTQFLAALNIPVGEVYSFDGKTMRAVTGEDAVRHMLSLFSHDSHLALGQIGVSGKENEIPALERLLDQATSHALIQGKLLLGDALHTQKATVKAILNVQADYLFVVKGNQKQLFRTIQAELEEAQAAQAALSTELRTAKNSLTAPGRTQPGKTRAVGTAALYPASTTIDSYTYQTTDRKRSVTTTVTALRAASGQQLVTSLTGSNHWKGVVTAGILHRTGTRTSKDGTVSVIDETIGFISSRILTAEQVARTLREHWCIENRLHWIKDVVFLEDKQTLRRGKAPQIMSFMRSMCISVCNILKLRSISDTIHNLEKSTELLGQFLKTAAIV